MGTTEPEADTDGPALDTAAVEDGPGTIADPAPAGRHGRRERPARGDPLALPLPVDGAQRLSRPERHIWIRSPPARSSTQNMASRNPTTMAITSCSTPPTMPTTVRARIHKTANTTEAS